MKKIALMMSAAGLAFMAMNAAHASDGKISFQGSVVASTCKVNDGKNDLTVPLPKASTNQFTGVGSTAGRTPFKLTLSGCATDTTNGEGGDVEAPVKKVSVAFEPGGTVDLASGRLNLEGGTGAAGNLQIQILNDKYEQIMIGAASANQKVQVADIDTSKGGSGTATLQFAAEYYATAAAVTGGAANSHVTYSLTYP
ncbi:type 1 fimbrial protein [Burkholderia sp. Bp9002]|nr:type 1 fimbrial protein [Burkholderia sp. Bp9002]